MAAAMWLSRLGDHPAVVDQRGWLGALLALEVHEPLAHQLAKRDPAPPALLGILLDALLLDVVLLNEVEHPRGRLCLGQDAVGRLTSLALPPAVPVGFCPGTPKGSHDWLAIARPLPVPKRAAGTQPYERARSGLWDRHERRCTVSVGCRATVGQRSHRATVAGNVLHQKHLQRGRFAAFIYPYLRGLELWPLHCTQEVTGSIPVGSTHEMPVNRDPAHEGAMVRQRQAGVFRPFPAFSGLFRRRSSPLAGLPLVLIARWR